MKKSIFAITVLFTSIASISVAQDGAIREKLTFGLKAGANISNVYDQQGQEFNADAKAGFAGGAFVGLPINKYIGVQPEILVSQKGYTGSGILLGTPYSNTRTTTFLDLPLQLQIKPVEFITLLAGVEYSYLLAQNDKYTYGANSSEQNQEFQKDDARRSIFGAVAGLDVNVQHFVFSTKVCWDLLNNARDGSTNTPRYKNVWVQATVGFRLYTSG